MTNKELDIVLQDWRATGAARVVYVRVPGKLKALLDLVIRLNSLSDDGVYSKIDSANSFAARAILKECIEECGRRGVKWNDYVPGTTTRPFKSSGDTGERFRSAVEATPQTGVQAVP